MRNIQIIDGAENCAYDIFSATEEEFSALFPNPGQNVQFIEDVTSIVEEDLGVLMQKIFSRKVEKAVADGISGTLFYGLVHKKIYYPDKTEQHAVAALR